MTADLAIFQLAPLAIAWGLLVLLAAGFVRGYSGFGFSAITVAGLSFIVSPAVAVVTAILLEVASSLLQARAIWRDIDWRGSMVLLAGGLIGNPLGVLVLDAVSPTPMKTAVYCYVLGIAIVLLFARPTVRNLGTPAWFGIGAVAGAINGATALSGLFIVAIMTLTATPPARMRATLIAYFFFSDFYAAGLLGWRGMITQQLVWQCVYAFPVVAIGIWFGSRHFLSTSDAQFRRSTLSFLAALSLAGLASLALQQF